MESQLITELARYGIWPLLGVVAMVLYRSEIGRLIAAPRTDRSIEHAMGQMVGLFRENLDHFERANTGIAALRAELERQTQVLHRIIEELVRK